MKRFGVVRIALLVFLQFGCFSVWAQTVFDDGGINSIDTELEGVSVSNATTVNFLPGGRSAPPESFGWSQGVRAIENSVVNVVGGEILGADRDIVRNNAGHGISIITGYVRVVSGLVAGGTNRTFARDGGDGIHMDDGNVLIEGGQIFGGDVTLPLSDAGRGIALSGGELQISGGEIRGGDSPNDGDPGEGVSIVQGRLEMSGGTVIGGDQVNDGFGSFGISAMDSQLVFSAGEITGGSSSVVGIGNSAISQTGGHLNVSGGQFTGGLNENSSRHHAVLLSQAEINLSGGIFIGGDPVGVVIDLGPTPIVPGLPNPPGNIFVVIEPLALFDFNQSSGTIVGGDFQTTVDALTLSLDESSLNITGGQFPSGDRWELANSSTIIVTGPSIRVVENGSGTGGTVSGTLADGRLIDVTYVRDASSRVLGTMPAAIPADRGLWFLVLMVALLGLLYLKRAGC